MHVTPYLFFEGRCEEAVEFYCRALGAKVSMLLTFGEAPEPAEHPPGSEDKVMHANLLIGHTVVMVSDGSCGGTSNFRGFSLSLAAADEAEARRLFEALAEDGEVQMPLTRTFWSPSFGMVKDRFGVSWMITVMPS